MDWGKLGLEEGNGELGIEVTKSKELELDCDVWSDRLWFECIWDEMNYVTGGDEGCEARIDETTKLFDVTTGVGKDIGDVDNETL